MIARNRFHGFEAILAANPEASTTVSFGLLLFLGIGGVVIAALKNAAGIVPVALSPRSERSGAQRLSFKLGTGL